MNWLRAAMVPLTVGILPVLAQAPQFEVASVRQHTAPLSTIMGLTISGSRVRLEGYTVALLVMEAYRLKGRWQLSLPGALENGESAEIYYDIVARGPGEKPLTKNDARQMLQALLTDRFKLTIHHEAKETPVYALVPGRNGSKLKASTDDGQCSIHVSRVTGGQSYSLTNCGIASLIEVLDDGMVDRPVMDQTQMEGTYDCQFTAAPHFMNGTDSDVAQISPFTAIQQLGFRLEPRKVPMETIVVDSFQKPSDN